MLPQAVTASSYDLANRLTSVAGVARYSYNAAGRRQTITPASGPATGLLYDGLATVQEQQNGAVSATLANGAGLDEHLGRTPAGGADVTLLADALGSTLALATSAGTVATRYGYDPYV